MNSIDKQFKPAKKEVNSDIEFSTMTLFTTDAVASSFNTQFIWQNVSMRQVLGTLYSKYSKFSLQMGCLCCLAASATLGTDAINDTAINLVLRA